MVYGTPESEASTQAKRDAAKADREQKNAVWAGRTFRNGPRPRVTVCCMPGGETVCEKERVCVYVCVRESVCVCESERESERERECVCV